MQLQSVIGLEVHVQLSTRSKIFCGCSTRFGAAPNTQICPVCTGQPGALPVLNRSAVDYALKMALATGCQIRSRSRFARKNYFYPDLPKGYQISQYDEPLAEQSAVQVRLEGQVRQIRLNRIHLEEDAGKNLHRPRANLSMVDLNRAGVPLIEIVSEPDIQTPAEAAEYMRTLRSIARALAISDGNMEQGSLRCDANISLRPVGQSRLGTKVEIKNINSFRFVQKALEFEVKRQTELLGRGETIRQETRLWNAEKGVTESMRSKEEAHDYRYFPDPDLPPVVVEGDRIDVLRQELPELPTARHSRFVEQLGLSQYDAAELTRERQLADYFEEVVRCGAQPKAAANWLLTELLSRIDDVRELEECSVDAARTAELLSLVASGEISGKLAKKIWLKMWDSGRSAREVAEAEGLFQQSDRTVLEAEVDRLLAQNPERVKQYRAGKSKLLGFFMGQLMKATRGKANPQIISDLLKEKLQP